MSAKDDVPPDSSQWRSAPGAVPPCRVHCLGFRNCRATGNCGPGRPRCAYGRPPRACAPYSQEHRPYSSDAVVEAIPLPEASPVAERLPASHQCQRPRGRFLLDQQGCRCVALWEDGRASRSARKRVRKVSVAGSAHARQKAREGRAGGQLLAVEQGHEGLRKGEEPLVKLLQGAFATDGVAEEDGEKVDHLVVPKAAASKAHEAQVMASRTPSLR